MLNNSHRSGTHKRRNILIGILLTILLICVLSSVATVSAEPAEGGTSQSDYADDIIGSLDFDGLDGLIDGFDDGSYDIFGGSDFASVLKRIVNGDFSFDYSNLITFIFSAIGTGVSDLLVLLVTIISIAIVYSILGALKGKSSAESISKIVHFASVAAVIAVVGASTVSMFKMCADTLGAMTAQINVILPIILTLMAAVGATSTATVFQPAVAVLSGGLFNLISVLLLPMLIVSFVFGVIGNISSEVKLSKTSDFFNSSVKWLFGTGFFILSAFMSVQGITASVFDGVAMRGMKFTIGKFVPVIGGYLSDGFNLVVSGGILVKNALGYTALLLLAVTIIPVVIKIGIYSLCLKLAAAAVEPLGDKLMSDMLTGISKTAGLTGALMAGAAFLYFVFLLIVLSSGNIFI